jgi:uncharacterized membrane protein YqjE
MGREAEVLRKIRDWALALIYLDFLWTLAGWIATGLVALVLLIVVVIRHEYNRAPELVGTALVAGGLLGFVGWISRDARKAAKRLRRQREEADALREGKDKDDMENT